VCKVRIVRKSKKESSNLSLKTNFWKD
jgi:hypothetical protein